MAILLPEWISSSDVEQFPLWKAPIQMKIKSFDCSRCPWIFAFSSVACVEYKRRICFKDKILLRLMFILSTLVLRVVFALLLLSVFHFILLSSWHQSVGSFQMNLKILKLISTTALHCKSYPASQGVYEFTLTLSPLGGVRKTKKSSPTGLQHASFWMCQHVLIPGSSRDAARSCALSRCIQAR